jgi:putative aldouronate transport system substrate-binding protein
VPWQYVSQRPYVNYQADIPGFAKGAHEAQQVIIPAGIEDPTLGYLSATAVGRGAAAMTTWSDGVRDVILGRKTMADYDTIVKEWKSNVGDTIRKEYMDAMAGAKP